MSESKRQSLLVIAIALIIISAIIAYFSLSQPKVYVDAIGTSASTTTDEDEISQFPVNINTCTAQDLMTVKGIGESTAQAIVEYRDAIGSYSDLSELKNIKGIGESLFEQISPYLCV